MGDNLYRLKKFNDVSIVGVEGELSSQNVNDFEKLLDSLSKRNEHNVILNMEGLRHLDYKLVQKIADRIIEFQCDGGDLKMANASRYIKQIIQAMGLEEEIYDSLEEALLSFLGTTSQGRMQ